MTVAWILDAIVLGIVPAGIVLLALTRMGSFLGAEAALRVAAAVAAPTSGRAAAAADLQEIVRRHFSVSCGLVSVLLVVARYTLASLALCLFVYAYGTPDIIGEFTSGRALTQFLIDGFTLAYASNLLVFLGYGRRAERGTLTRFGARFLALDLLRKALAFLLLAVVTFVPFSMLLGRSGDLQAALASVPAILTQAVTGRSLTAVYLYSVLCSSLPLYVVALIQRMQEHSATAAWIHRVFYFADFERKPLLALALVVSCGAGLFGAAAALVLRGAAAL